MNKKNIRMFQYYGNARPELKGNEKVLLRWGI